MEHDLSLYERLQREMESRKTTLSVAESCTCGLIAHRITEVPGASRFFKTGIVAYSNEAKVELLGVREVTLARHGAVSEDAAREMAEGASKVGGSEFALSVTGIAGPGGGSPDKPVGTVFLGFYRSGGSGPEVRHMFLSGTRSEIKRKTATVAIELFLRFLEAHQ